MQHRAWRTGLLLAMALLSWGSAIYVLRLDLLIGPARQPIDIRWAPGILPIQFAIFLAGFVNDHPHSSERGDYFLSIAIPMRFSATVGLTLLFLVPVAIEAVSWRSCRATTYSFLPVAAGARAPHRVE